jgi:transposase InsO family protein
VAQRGGALPGFDELEAARVEANMTVVAFCQQLGIPRPTWYRWKAAGSSVKGPWPTPAQDAVEADAKALAAAFDAWGHRKLASLKRTGIDDIEPGPVSDSTMYRALKRNGLCLPVGYTGEVRQLAGARRETFIDPPTRRNRLWQADFSEFETLGQGTWNLGGVVDYWAKVNLACTVSVTKTTRDAIAFFEDALAEVEALLGVTWVQDLTDPDTGEIGKLKLVTDNGSCFKSRDFAAWVASKRHIVHIRTRKKSPWTNGVIERFFEALKCERLYRHDISDGVQLAAHALDFKTIYNSIRPHESIAMARPLERYRQTPTTNFPDPESVSIP